MEMNDILETISNNPRYKWIDLLLNELIHDPNDPNILLGEDGTPYAFNFEQLREGWSYNLFNHGDFIMYPGGKVSYVYRTPLLDYRNDNMYLDNPRLYASRLITMGNTSDIIESFFDYNNNPHLLSRREYVDPDTFEATIIDKSEVPIEFIKVLEMGFRGEILVY